MADEPQNQNGRPGSYRLEKPRAVDGWAILEDPNYYNRVRRYAEPDVGLGRSLVQLLEVILHWLTGSDDAPLFAAAYGLNGKNWENLTASMAPTREAYQAGRIPMNQAITAVIGASFPEYTEKLKTINLGFLNFNAGSEQEKVAKAIGYVKTTSSRGIPEGLMISVWGAESVFSTQNRSPTNVLGAYHITRGTIGQVLDTYGNTMISQMEGKGLDSSITLIREFQSKIQEIRNSGRAVEWPKLLDSPEWQARLDKLRTEPTIATFAASHYLQETADKMGLDITKEENWAWIYMGYNLGPANAIALRSAHASNKNTRAIDVMPEQSAAHSNYRLFDSPRHDGPSDRQATVEEVLLNYSRYLSSRVDNYVAATKPPAAPAAVRTSSLNNFKDAVTPTAENTGTPQEQFASNAAKHSSYGVPKIDAPVGPELAPDNGPRVV